MQIHTLLTSLLGVFNIRGVDNSYIYIYIYIYIDRNNFIFYNIESENK